GDTGVSGATDRDDDAAGDPLVNHHERPGVTHPATRQTGGNGTSASHEDPRGHVLTNLYEQLADLDPLATHTEWASCAWSPDSDPIGSASCSARVEGPPPPFALDAGPDPTTAGTHAPLSHGCADYDLRRRHRHPAPPP